MIFVGLSIQEVEVPLPTLLGLSVDVRVVPLTTLVGPRGPSPVRTSPLLGFWCKECHDGTVTTGISVPVVKVVQKVLLVRLHSSTGFLSQVRINADYTT